MIDWSEVWTKVITAFIISLFVPVSALFSYDNIALRVRKYWYDPNRAILKEAKKKHSIGRRSTDK